jgi:catechol 2,3-dioxygenase-like lactoylglutathione lyase family enzyme
VGNFRLHHVALTVKSLKSSIYWYTKVFDLKIEKQFRNKLSGAEVVWLSNKELRLEIFHFKNGKPLPSYRRALSHDLRVSGIKHFAIQVADLSGTLHRLVSRGVEVETPITLGNSGYNYAFIKDPTGNLIELIDSNSYYEHCTGSR